MLATGRAALARLVAVGAFSELRPAAFYLLQLRHEGRTQDAIVGGVQVADIAAGKVKLHERVRAERANHLAGHFAIVGVQSSPLALAHHPNPAVTAVKRAVSNGQPLVEVMADDGLEQRVWAVPEGEATITLIEAFLPVDLYLIDGHHRTAAALAHREAAGPGRADRVLSAVFDADELHNMAHHRMLHLGRRSEQFLADLARLLPVRLTADPADVEARADDELALYHHGQWQLVTVPAQERLADLDPVRLQTSVLGPLLGIDATRYTEALTYRPGTETLADLVTEADHHGAILALMRPVPVGDLLTASDNGVTMPPKSTYFVPKARSGVFVRPVIDD